MRVLVVSDTHAPFRWRSGPPPALADALAARPDLILHAGDVCRPEVLGYLSAFAPVRAVMGNNDTPQVQAWGARLTFESRLEGVNVAMIHDAGARDGRAARMRRRFPDADLVIYGHSHIPADLTDERLGLRLFNPGSPTDPRTQPFGTFGELELDDGAVLSTRIVRADR